MPHFSLKNYLHAYIEIYINFSKQRNTMQTLKHIHFKGYGVKYIECSHWKIKKCIFIFLYAHKTLKNIYKTSNSSSY